MCVKLKIIRGFKKTNKIWISLNFVFLLLTGTLCFQVNQELEIPPTKVLQLELNPPQWLVNLARRLWALCAIQRRNVSILSFLDGEEDLSTKTSLSITVSLPAWHTTFIHGSVIMTWDCFHHLCGMMTDRLYRWIVCFSGSLSTVKRRDHVTDQSAVAAISIRVLLVHFLWIPDLFMDFGLGGLVSDCDFFFFLIRSRTRNSFSNFYIQFLFPIFT